MNKFSDELKKFQLTMNDAARISKREFLRGVENAKKQVVRYQFVNRRKELLADLGRNLYDAYRDGLPEDVKNFINETEFKEIIQEIEELDAELERRLKDEK